jgi:hypothetical protein
MDYSIILKCLGNQIDTVIDNPTYNSFTTVTNKKLINQIKMEGYEKQMKSKFNEKLAEVF